jgi:hypothetical protein
MRSDPEARRAAGARDVARRRLRRLTQVSAAATVVVGGTFAALAAGSTHPKKAVAQPSVRRSPVAPLTQAPAPPLVGVQGSESAPSAAPAPPAAAPTPSYEPPVVVSGGS